MVAAAEAWRPPQPGQPIGDWDELLARYKIGNTGRRTGDRQRRDRRA